MKKTISLALVLLLCLSLCACGSSTEKNKKEPVILTTENIGDYITVCGEYKNGDYHSTLLYYVSTADLDFQAYSTTSGTFENVEITVRADLSEKAGAINEKWHLVGSDNKNSVEFTFKLPASGEYTSSYSIECNRATWKLSGSSKLEIVNVNGTFTPNT